ncbi:Asp-tRNA(Asn)/Glu-tRNA(Gln) amidotransferase subunit GatC [candidate division WOR-3 bacterium]|nr:Asp-tRNA(Asn)/Glu-tRNA(Gln) amidotransferase subunit GatC [candidate division WOR-3 bacterium]
MISEKEVKHIAKLARIKLTEEEVSCYQKQLKTILEYFAKIQKIDTKNVLPMARSGKIKNALREDKPFPSNEDLRKKPIEAAPQKEKNFIRVHPVK